MLQLRQDSLTDSLPEEIKPSARALAMFPAPTIPMDNFPGPTTLEPTEIREEDLILLEGGVDTTFPGVDDGDLAEVPSAQFAEAVGVLEDDT